MVCSLDSMDFSCSVGLHCPVVLMLAFEGFILVNDE